MYIVFSHIYSPPPLSNSFNLVLMRFVIGLRNIKENSIGKKSMFYRYYPLLNLKSYKRRHVAPT